MARLAVIPVLAILLFTLCREETVVLQSAGESIEAATVVETPGSTETPRTTEVADLNNSLQMVDEMRRFMVERLRYPREAAESGRMGRVDLYVTVDAEGRVTRITERPPATGYVDISEIVVVGYGIPGVELIKRLQAPFLVNEFRRVIRSFPLLDIPEVKGTTMKLSVNFVLQ